jgi:phosphoribosylamine--glycine ligase
MPANAGIQPTSRYTPYNLNNSDNLIQEIINFLETTKIDIILIANVAFLFTKKLQDAIVRLKIPVASCSNDHSILEWFKHKGKQLLNELNIPSPKSRIFKRDDLLDKYFDIPRPWVLKFIADWRAGLQTVVITDDNYEQEFKSLQDAGKIRFMSIFGNFVNQHFIVEEFMKSKREYSYHFISNNTGWKYLGSARDYKKFQDGDKGFNTAGMGSYSPVDINPKVHEYADKIYNHLKNTGNVYKGIMYLGIMEDEDGNPHVLEINTRPGDPEFQTIALTYGDDVKLSDLFLKCANDQSFDDIDLSFKKEAVSLRIVHSKYREFVDKHAKQKDLDPEDNTFNPQLWAEPPEMYISYNQDRRILNSIIATSAETRKEAADKIYNYLENVIMHEFIYRKDIGYLE